MPSVPTFGRITVQPSTVDVSILISSPFAGMSPTRSFGSLAESSGRSFDFWYSLSFAAASLT